VPARPVRAAATALALLAVGSLAGWGAGWTGRDPFLIALVLEIVFALALRGRVRRAVADLDERAHDLSLLAELLARLEREPVEAPRLRRVWRAFDVAGHPPSRRIARLARLLHLLNARQNQFFAPIGVLLLWSEHLAFAIERWRATEGPAIAGWLAAVGEVEALGALAAYSYENPADPFPEIVGRRPPLRGRGPGPPAPPADRSVRNDLRLGEDVRVLVVSGSNMSGKSTLLRAVGVNAGARPGRGPRAGASAAALPPGRGGDPAHPGLAPGRALPVLRRDHARAAAGRPGGGLPALLFLLDEIFAGTNSHDRRLGAEAVVRGLLDRGSIGLVTTHDLALAEIADGLAPRAANVHFEDHLEDGVMTFDYLHASRGRPAQQRAGADAGRRAGV
jgi:hypothetical protein